MAAAEEADTKRTDPPRAATGATRRDAARAIARTTQRGVTGRPTKLTDAVQATLVEAISSGMPMTPAAWMAGVSPQAVSDWTTRGEADLASGIESAHARFADAIKRAEGSSVQSQLRLLNSVPTDWQRHAWMLERRWPEWFGRRDALAVQHSGEVRIVVEHVKDWHARDIIDVEATPAEPRRGGRRGRELDGQPAT